MTYHIHPSAEISQEFYQQYKSSGKVTMLNLLRFKAQADYSDCPDLKPDEILSGKDAYRLYMKLAAPMIEKAGGKVLFYGKSQYFLIGPMEEKWDTILLVQYPSADHFISFAESEAYLKIAGHRTAALQDSRLLPTTNLR